MLYSICCSEETVATVSHQSTTQQECESGLWAPDVRSKRARLYLDIEIT